MPSRLTSTSAERAEHLVRQGRAIQAARKKAGLSQPQAAAWFGVSVSGYRAWEHGVRLCPPEARYKIVLAWGGDAALLGPPADCCALCGRKW